MTKKISSSESAVFTRHALLEGSRDGSMPAPVGKWVWPGAAVALALGTAWGAGHIEDQVHQAAPQILAAAGIKPAELEFTTSYRTVDVKGVVSANHSRSHVQTMLEKNIGPNGAKVRKANVHTTESTGADSAEATSQPPTTEVRVSATLNHQELVLNGTVPSQEDVDILSNAARQSTLGINVVNNLTVSTELAQSKDMTESINNLAMVVANFDTGIADAHIDLDGDLLTGNITTASQKATDKVRAYLPSSTIGIITDYDTPQVIAITKPETPETVISETEIPEQDTFAAEAPEQQIDLQATTPAIYVTPAIASFERNQITQLQQKIDELEPMIRDQVTFVPASSVLTQTAKTVLDDIIAALHTYPNTSIEVSGHTDSQSSAEYNLALSHQRASVVARYITSNGIEDHRLIAVGFGESQPIATNDTSAGRSLNRRVEFRVY